jgi:hypothetical protein
MAFIVYPNGNMREITADCNGVIPLSLLQDVVGGEIDARYIGNNTALLFNDDAPVMGMPTNLIGTVLAQILTQPASAFVFICGTVILADMSELGETIIPSLVIVEGK